MIRKPHSTKQGLIFTPKNGEFTILVRNKNLETGKGDTVRHTIDVDLLGTDGSPTTLVSLAAQLDTISGIAASVSIDNQLVLNSESPVDLEFGFEKDSSGVLAALGINTFFTGADARNLGVNRELLSDGAKFARKPQWHQRRCRQCTSAL